MEVGSVTVMAVGVMDIGYCYICEWTEKWSNSWSLMLTSVLLHSHWFKCKTSQPINTLVSITDFIYFHQKKFVML